MIDTTSAPTVAFARLDALWIQLTGTWCNLACTHCLNGSGPHDLWLRPLDADTIRHAIDEGETFGVSEIYFTGGEPFLHREIVPLLERALAVAPTTVLTNGTMITPTVADALAASSDYSLEIRVSVDDVDAAINDRIRGDGSLARAARALTLLHQRGLLPILTATDIAARPGVDRYATYRDFLRSLGIDKPRVKLLPVFPVGRAACDPPVRLTEETLDGFDRGTLQCATTRAVADGGVYACPILARPTGRSALDGLARGIVRICAIVPFRVRDMLANRRDLSQWMTSGRSESTVASPCSAASMQTRTRSRRRSTTRVAEARRHSTASEIWAASARIPTASFRCCATPACSRSRATTMKRSRSVAPTADAGTPIRVTITTRDSVTRTRSPRRRTRPNDGSARCLATAASDLDGAPCFSATARRGGSTSSCGNRRRRPRWSVGSSTKCTLMSCGVRIPVSSGVAGCPTVATSNVGVIGRPENDGTRRAWYAMLTDDAGDLDVTFVPVDYDADALAREMEAESLPPEFVETIRTGWWTTCLEVLPARERARGRF